MSFQQFQFPVVLVSSSWKEKYNFLLSTSLSLSRRETRDRQRENRLKLGNKRKEKAIKEALCVLQKDRSCTPAGIRSICEETYKKQCYMTMWKFILTELASVPGQKEYIFSPTLLNINSIHNSTLDSL